MSELISRQIAIDLIDAELAGETNQDIVFGLNRARDLISVEPAIIPQVFINVTGGIAEGLAASHRVDLNVLDYDITDNEQSDYVVDEEGNQVWIYGEGMKPDPEGVARILAYPEIGEQEDEDA